MKKIDAARSLLTMAATITLLLSGCSGSDSDIALINGPQNDGPSTSNIIWTLVDDCNDGTSMKASFIETRDGKSTGYRWPGDNKVYVFEGSRRFVLDCRAGTSACVGAEPYTQDGFYWGTSLDGSYPCQNCCRSCGSGEFTTTLSC